MNTEEIIDIIGQEAYDDLSDDVYEKLSDTIWDEVIETIDQQESDDKALKPLAERLSRLGFYTIDDRDSIVVHNRDSPGELVELDDEDIIKIIMLWDAELLSKVKSPRISLKANLPHIRSFEIEGYDSVKNNPSEASESDYWHYNDVLAKLGLEVQHDIDYIKTYIPYDI